MAKFLKRKYPYALFFKFRICFYLFFLNFRNVRLKYVSFKWILHFFTFLSPPYFLEITNMVHEKNLKKHRYPKCIFSKHFRKHVKNFDIFLWNLDPKTKLFMRQVRILISRFFYVPISPTFCGQYICTMEYPKLLYQTRRKNPLVYKGLNGPYPEKTWLCCIWATKGRTILHICAILSAPLLFAHWLVW